MEKLEIRNLSFFYPETTEPAISDINLTVKAGDFFVLFGFSGSGKSTLLRLLKPSVSPNGKTVGEILLDGKSVSSLSHREETSLIGFVSQNPDEMIVTDKVWHELAFGLESLGFSTEDIRRRVAEMASFFGITSWFQKNCDELSGGQKQLLNLASVMVCGPSVLVLDEPTSQLDPVAASNFIDMLRKINRELGTTIILSEHRLEDALSNATDTAILDSGKVLVSGTVSETGEYLKKTKHPMFRAMPCAMRVWAGVDSELTMPVNVNEGRQFLSGYIKSHSFHEIESKELSVERDTVLTADELYFRYEKNSPDVISAACLSVYKAELFGILGANGTGKSTLLKALTGELKTYSGSIICNEKVALLPQNVKSLFVKKTLLEDLQSVSHLKTLSKEEAVALTENVISLCRLEGFENRHPYDLSGGEQQRAALAKILLTDPGVLLLDEPTKGFDAAFKNDFASILASHKNAGVTVIIVSHDIEFCAENCDRIGLFFDGKIISEGTAQSFFSENRFYTTPAIRMSNGILNNIVTADDIIKSLGGENLNCDSTAPVQYNRIASEGKESFKDEKLPLWRKVCSAFCTIAAACIFVYSAKTEVLSDLIENHTLNGEGFKQIIIYALLIVSLLGAALFSFRKKSYSDLVEKKQKLSKRTKTALAINLIAVPLTLFTGLYYFSDSGYYITALLVLAECIVPFFIAFEGKHPKAREITVIAVLCALAVAGRAAFFMLPQFKPVIAISVIAGVSLGGETGFLVGAISMLVSNMMFSQGPWTPFQMFAMGLIGFIAGILYRGGFLRATRVSLSVFGAIAAIVIYGGIMNPLTLLIWERPEALTFESVAAYYLSGFLIDCVHASANFIFLWFLSEPMLEKLNRIKIKYGLTL